MSENLPVQGMDPEGLPKLFIGPWVGELGIEILHWQGVARAAARSRAWGEVVVSSRPEREILYKDFADRFVPFSPSSYQTCGARCRGYDESMQSWEGELQKWRGDVWLTPFGDEDHFYRIRALAVSESIYRDFSVDTQPPDEPFDLLIHARATNKHRQDYKNWPVASWASLVASLPNYWRIASIGDPLGAHKIEGTADLRGISLESLAAYCRAAKMLVGPSSGPVHFAMHCGLPVVIWMGEHRHHYFPQGNPQDVPVICFDTWQPRVEDVLARIRDLHLIVKTRSAPIRHLVFATKRSGHHAVVEWIAKLNPSYPMVWLNDCVSRTVQTDPYCRTTIPTEKLLPKQLSESSPRDLVTDSGRTRNASERIFSIEGCPVGLITQLPEALEAKSIVFVLRDAANFAASFHKAFPQVIAREGILGRTLTEMLKIYHDYLNEAIGRTHVLGELRSKTVFISYNRWHSNAEYRREVARSLGCEIDEAPPGIVSPYGPRSAFQHETTPAQELKTLERWNAYLKTQPLWIACRNPALVQAEREFHGPSLPLSRIEDAWKT